ncbi:Uncharacterised protein [Vibrio cholerae]|nr:Uncharacterised protein [Vibrio cholerae]
MATTKPTNKLGMMMAHTMISTSQSDSLNSSTNISGVMCPPRYKAKLPAKVDRIRFQPSTNTNNINLNGKETIMGESIIIPMAMSTEATTKSMIKKGKNSIKPIWKAVFNSEVIKAGISTAIDTCSGAVTCAPDIITRSRVPTGNCLMILSPFC